MAVPRQLLLALVGLSLLVVAFTAMRAGRDRSERAPEPAERPAAIDNPRSGASEKLRPTGQRDAAPSLRPSERAPTIDTPLPRALSRALSQRKVVVLVFSRRGPADNTGTRTAMRRLKVDARRSGRVVVFSERIDRVAYYGRIVAGLGISQDPSIVIVDRNRRARLLEGFVDSGSLRQHLADALR